ncbi:DUF2794 domain-containing protein [Methylocella tundrae]|uniref:DUF2794 domain-containing protein n=1 Tax=Methylocella tundrae TaxID=227605 RepID=A0A4U8Z5A2_METTU|nr:DUF2794 domain-containing protein [Methylocella tundrae]WPP04347.1 DUF2794 domain-containing protein [Methylocella tundrae]VFU10690.1 conserved protein of unknown function [Methylocella tundrae]
MNDPEPAEDSRLPIMTDGRVQAFASRAAPVSPRLVAGAPPVHGSETVSFDRFELREILNLYGRKVAEGEWRDYAVDFTPQKAVFSIYRRASECALFRIEKTPKLAKKQGAYSVVATTGLVLKRGHDLRRVIAILDKRLKLVSG